MMNAETTAPSTGHIAEFVLPQPPHSIKHQQPFLSFSGITKKNPYSRMEDD